MKVKFKGGAKGMLIEHGEKAVFGLGVFCFLLFAYSLFGRETLPPDKEPMRLNEGVEQTKMHMEQSTWDATREGLAVVNYISRAKREDVVAKNFALLIPLDEPLRVSKHKRTDPALLAVVSLRTAAGVGAFALKSERAAPEPAAPATVKPSTKRKKPNPNDELEAANAAAAAQPAKRTIEGEMHAGGITGITADANTRRENWVVITALVPIKKQFAEYEQTFKDTIPVTDGVPGLNKEMEALRDSPVYRRPILERVEIVDGNEQANWQPVNMKGLGKFIKQWAVTAPEIVGRDYLDPVYTMPLGPLVGVDWDESVGHEPEIPLAAKEELEQNVMQAKQAQQAAEEPADADNPFGGATDAPAKAAAKPAPASKRPEKKIVEYRLLRFFDFDVEPGKSYRYRARLVVKNPNYNLPDKYLKSIDSKKDEYHETPWSEPSPAATVPFGNDMRVAMVQPGRGAKEATIKVKLTTIDSEMGLPAVMEEDVGRGTLLNFVRTVDVADPVKKEWVTRDNVRFETNAVVLDIRGGHPLSTKDKSLTAPGEALIFNSDMKLVAHNELDDLDVFDSSPVSGAESGSDPKKVDKKGKKGDPNDLLNGAEPRKKKSRRRRG